MARSWDDDEALPLFFILRALACILAPWTAAMAWWLSFPGRHQVQRLFPETTRDGLRIRSCQTAATARKRDAEIAHLKSRKQLFTVGFVFRTFMFLVLWAWFAFVIKQYIAACAKNALYEGFDPHALLGVSKDTKEFKDSELNKAFRREAFKYHPDKNKDPKAVDQFLLVKKAFDALTDPEAMSNFKRFGNPDGPQYVELFAVSTFIKDKDASRANGYMTYKKNMFRAADLQVSLLGIVVAFLGVLVTFIVLASSSDDSGDPTSVFGSKRLDVVSQLQSADSVADIAAVMLRFTARGSLCGRRQSVQDYSKLLEHLKPWFNESPASMDEVLFLTHVHRQHHLLDDGLIWELDALLLTWSSAAREMARIAADGTTASAVVGALRLHRCLAQALDPGTISAGTGDVLQVPHIGPMFVQEPSLSRVGLRAFLDQSASERRRIMPSLGQQECADVEELVRAAPRLELSVATAVLAEPGAELREGETAKLRVVLRRVNLGKDEAVGAVHAPFFPGASLAEVWWLVFSSPDGQSAPPLLCRRLASFVGRDLQGEFEFEVPASGKCTCLLSIMCDSYSGLDVEKRICFTAKRADAR
mmetsp:Transcript_121492/g.388665  ORF Transcript_121492/g.388665 Transcript_121492/m.388665 type:complete len:589 (+) Transcript_121492:45-1811(+)